MNRKKILTGIIAYLAVIALYLAFFAYPVSPATLNASGYTQVKSEVYERLPYVVYKVYVKPDLSPAIVVVATIRTPFVPDSTYSKILQDMEGIIENETEERYHASIDLVFVGETTAAINGKKVVMDEYDVHLKYLNQYDAWGRPDTVKLYLGAFFCNEKYESVFVAYLCPPVFQSDFTRVMDSIRC